MSMTGAALNFAVHDKNAAIIIAFDINHLTQYVVGSLATFDLFTIEIDGYTFSTGNNSLSRIIVKHSYSHNAFLLDVSLSHGTAARENSFPQAHD
ncbi:MULTISPECIES: hypothetical protein [Kosakonia]|uniref:hypothetical protein n=1 Tax=Kosakonia TaxID=1330547 RepID=UPI001596A768|nr:hypothetical protein [Kosakonia pseudosacchari]